MLSAPGKVYSHNPPQGNSVSSLGSEILAKYCHKVQRSYSSVQCWVPLGKSQLSLCPRGTRYHQMAMKCYHQWTGHCLMLGSPGEDSCHCAPRELSITTWPWSTISACHHQWTGHIVKCITSRLWTIITSGLTILFNVECPRGSLPSLCPRGTQYHQLAMEYHDQFPWGTLRVEYSPGALYIEQYDVLWWW